MLPAERKRGSEAQDFFESQWAAMEGHQTGLEQARTGASRVCVCVGGGGEVEGHQNGLEQWAAMEGQQTGLEQTWRSELRRVHVEISSPPGPSGVQTPIRGGACVTHSEVAEAAALRSELTLLREALAQANSKWRRREGGFVCEALAQANSKVAVAAVEPALTRTHTPILAPYVNQY
ncbi:hypothetical protein T492DRAFT_843177 [Pavlovales sp. CCMP2436]|nr:hypothetical protein T492DRAFT_843177 [Pavlovales sp. CCMP2436]